VIVLDTSVHEVSQILPVSKCDTDAGTQTRSEDLVVHFTTGALAHNNFPDPPR
jgi:hypothetical protein